MTENTEINKKLKSPSLSIDWGILLAIFTAALYASGSAYYHGFLSEWGLDSTLFGRTFHETLYTAFIVWFELGAKTFLFAFFLGAILFIVLTVFYNKLLASPRMKRLVIKVLQFLRGKKRNRNHKLDEITAVKYSFWMFSISIGAIIMLMILLIILASFEGKGKGFSVNLKKQIVSRDKEIMKDVIEANGNGTLPVVIIDCSTSFCAVAALGNAQIYFMDLKSFKIILKK